MAMMSQGKSDDAFEFLMSTLAALMSQNRDLELHLAKLRKEQVGKSTEKIDPRQMMLMFEGMIEAAAAGDEVAVDPQEEDREDAQLDQEIRQAEEESGRTKTKRRKKRQPRTKPEVKREDHYHKVPEEERACGICGRLKAILSEDISRTFELVPAYIIEHIHHQEVLACPCCKDGVSTAAGPLKIIDRSPATAPLLADVIVCKYVDHIPLHRMHRMYGRIGITIPVSTMADWIAACADMLSPVVDVLFAQALTATVVRTDATGLKVLDSDSPENIVRGTIWCYVGDDLDVVFRYAPTGEGESGPWKFLAGRQGYVQADAANIFDRVFNGQVADAIEVGCWSHARRKLFALQDTDCRVAYPLRLIARLYRIEHLADAKGLEGKDRARLRQERSLPVLNKLKGWLAAIHAGEPPGAALAKAITYQINQWEALTRFVNDGRLDLDNNLCERQLRDIALGRKSYLFAGSHQAASRAAVLYSLTRTCAQHQVPPAPYLTDVLTKLASGWRQSRIDELLPGSWKALHFQETTHQ
jgi:transposase